MPSLLLTPSEEPLFVLVPRITLLERLTPSFAAFSCTARGQKISSSIDMHKTKIRDTIKKYLALGLSSFNRKIIGSPTKTTSNQLKIAMPKYLLSLRASLIFRALYA
jgi:hypothetical protein